MSDPVSHEYPARVEEQPLTVRDDNPMSILRLGVEKGIDAESIERLSALAERWADRRAAEEYNAGLMEFQRTVPEILKAKTASIATKSGSKYSYRYAPLDLIDRTVKPILSRLGFSYSWDSKIEAGLMVVACTLRHVNGHRESSSFSCPTDSPNPGMTGQQKHAGAMSFARRQSLTAVLGLTTTEPDDDGMDPTTISEEQEAKLRDLAASVGADEGRFLRYLGVKKWEDILASEYDRAVSALRAKGKTG